MWADGDDDQSAMQCGPTWVRDSSKVTWPSLGGDPAARSHNAQQFTALCRLLQLRHLPIQLGSRAEYAVDHVRSVTIAKCEVYKQLTRTGCVRARK